MAGLVKHYQDTMKGIPRLTNDWGALINLFDAVLVNGFNHVTILGITKANTASITATINLGSDHGFIDRQVVRIAGSTNGWDGDYKVLSVDTSSITIECTAEHPIVISGAASCFTAPADFEIVHQTPSESTEPKRAYRSTDPESLGLILLVHDFCSIGAATAGAKFAKVGLVESMTDIDTIVGNQLPEDANNWGWDGTYHGCAKWYYANPQYGNSYDQRNDTQAPLAGNRTFDLVVDGKSILLSVQNQWCNALYGLFEFYDTEIRGQNVLFAATGLNYNPTQAQNRYVTARGGIMLGYNNNIGPGGSASQPQTGLLWYNTAAIRQDQKISRAIALGFMTNNTAIDAASSSGFLLQMPILDSSFVFRGVIPFARMQMGGGRGGTYFTDDGKIKCLSLYLGNYGSQNYAIAMESL
ncbi:hypothetical protein [Acinetobacter towneri]|uniref:hypothetical protein n=1 Tax=Acinetobacter towneri TaxID=202956 RepID=UPI0002D00378|nr:hypothetical protein [Acinetobacter towneri]ENV69792.1 hypothetical protein F947_01469 [Acinetobacter towneri DSM 14962 = CIP 107472]